METFFLTRGYLTLHFFDFVFSYVDGIFGHPIKAYLMKHTPMPGGLLATYPDFLAGALIILLTVVVAFGVKISSKFNIFFASLNLCVIIFIFCKYSAFSFLTLPAFIR